MKMKIMIKGWIGRIWLSLRKKLKEMEQRIRKKILLKGVTTTPDDYLCEDGELAGSMGVESLNGGLQGAQGHGPKVVLDMKGRDFRVVFEHKVKPENNWIVWTGSSNRVLLWLKDGADFGGNITPENSLKCGSKSLPKVEAIGNTLIIVCENDEGEFETHYVLWKKEEDGTYGYQYLGTHIPELEMRFGLTLQGRLSIDPSASESYKYKIDDLEDFNVNDAGVHIAVRGGDKGNTNSPAITSAVRAVINKTFSEAQTNGLFVQPFLVRYALKMYDNTHVMVSQPVYMQVCDLDEYGGAPYCLISSFNKTTVEFIVAYIEAKLVYKVTSESIAQFADWSDIIKGVDVYVTPQIYTYTEDEAITETIGSNDTGKKYYDRIGNHYCIGSNQIYSGRGGRAIVNTKSVEDSFARRTVKSMISANAETTYAFNIGYKNKDDYYDEVKNFGQFYLLKSYAFDELVKDKLTWVEIDKNVLKNISTALTLERDSYHDHDEISAEYLYAYNGRLNMGGVKRKLYKGWNPSIMLPYQTKTDTNKANFQVSISINNDGQFSTIHSAVEELPADQSFAYLYYPSTGATNMTIKRVSDGKIKKFDLENHTLLNGSVFFEGYAYTAEDFSTDRNFPAEYNTTIDVSNKLHTSESGNPWIFLPTNINTIGNGKVMGMAAVTTALSQGQHGSFPMYCFTSEGIYSLSVNNTGGWVTSQTVTRDVIREGTPLLQIDNAIVFVSEQGVMLLQGDKTVLMSKDQSDKQRMKVSDLPGLSGLLTATGGLTDVGQMAADAMDESLLDYLDVDGMKIGLYYDYTNQRVAVGREDKPYCWLYSLNEATWYTEPWQLLNRVNSYPDCYAMYKATDGKYHMVLLNTNERMLDGDNSAATLGLPEGMFLLTRPIKLGEYADALKELENMTGEGRFDKTKMGMAVWGTRDYKQWYLVGSCKGMHLVRKHGSGFRALVVAVVGKLAKGDFLDSLTMQLQARYMQKMHGMGYKG